MLQFQQHLFRAIFTKRTSVTYALWRHLSFLPHQFSVSEGVGCDSPVKKSTQIFNQLSSMCKLQVSNLWLGTFNGIFSAATTRALHIWKFFKGSVNWISSVLIPKQHKTFAMRIKEHALWGPNETFIVTQAVVSVWFIIVRTRTVTKMFSLLS